MEFDWPVIFLSIACIGNSISLICLHRAVISIRRHLTMTEREIVQLINLHCQRREISSDDGIADSRSGRSAKHMESGLQDGGRSTSESHVSENLS